MEEIWKPITNFEEYSISNLGRIKNSKFGKERIINHKAIRYYYISLCKDGLIQCRSIHTLVAQFFLNYNPYDNDLVVDHIDGNIHNNRVDNLQIISRRDNSLKGKKRNKAGHLGVCWREDKKSWTVKILYKSKRITLGSFKEKEEAIELHNRFLKDIENNKFVLENYILERRERRKPITT